MLATAFEAIHASQPTVAMNALFPIACPNRAPVFTHAGLAGCPKPRSAEAGTAWVLIGDLAFDGAFDRSSLGAGIGRREDLEVAELAYTRALVVRSPSFEPALVHFKLGNALYDQERLADALREFLAILDDRNAETVHPEAMRRAALCLVDLGGFDRSLVRKDAPYADELRLKTADACGPDRCSH